MYAPHKPKHQILNYMNVWKQCLNTNATFSQYNSSKVVTEVVICIVDKLQGSGHNLNYLMNTASCASMVCSMNYPM